MSGLLRALEEAHPLYVLPKDDIASSVLVPALAATKSLSVMMGYFSSSSLAEIAPGLAVFLRKSNAQFQLIVSPFVTDSDFDVLTQEETQLNAVAQQMFLDEIPDEFALTRHTLECLAWLISSERLVLKIALMRNALFHHKVWLFGDEENQAALHGSTNLTTSALTRNREQLTLSRDWKSGEAEFHVARLRQEFEELWFGETENDCIVLPLPQAVAREVIERYKTNRMPSATSFEKLWNKAHGLAAVHDEEISNSTSLSIPEFIEYESGSYAHQGNAVAEWEAHERRGILEMATGSGKTIAAMICATRLQNEVDRLLVVVAAPYRPLISQWCSEIVPFGIRPTNLTAVTGYEARNREIKQSGRRLQMGLSHTEILVVSNDTLCTESFVRTVSQVRVPKLLIADECHNLGRAAFTQDPPISFEYRLGLSATPIRQFDEEGTEELIKYFGDICFSYPLEQAIGNCLTPYDYHVHPVELEPDEMEKWRDLTNEIASQSWKLENGEKDTYLDSLLRQRRLVLETARKKLDILVALLDEHGTRHLLYTLIYATDKDPEQLIEVNKILNGKGVLFHQFTQEESSSREKTENILSSFQDGVTQVLTAKRVLDEGVNIPQVKLAFVLASTTVRRQWIQRRGRLLRECRAINKSHAVIHDFVVLPPGAGSSQIAPTLDSDARRLVRSELERVWEFARLSRNSTEEGGPYEAVEHLQSLANERILD